MDMPPGSKLPVTVVIPTRNAMGAIESHLDAIRGWLAEVEQIVVVDSSEDGTLDYLKRELDLPNVSFFSRPRGLYESWNFAVRQASANYVYFSTVGDTIQIEGLRHLVDVIEAEDADILISPPAMRKDTGEPETDIRWPIHSLSEHLEQAGHRALSPSHAFMLSISYLPQTVLGSSASNLYRREFMVGNPFPEDWGHAADSAWFISSSLKARVSVTTRCVGQFVLHPKDPAAGPSVEYRHYADMFARAERALDESDLEQREKSVLEGWLDGLRVRYTQFFDRLEAHAVYFARRDAIIADLKEGRERFKARIATLEQQVRGYVKEVAQSNVKIVDLRRQIGAYERKHRSLLGITMLYFSTKCIQARNGWKMIRQRIGK